MYHEDYKVKMVGRKRAEFNKDVKYDHYVNNSPSERAREIFNTPAYGGRFNTKKEDSYNE